MCYPVYPKVLESLSGLASISCTDSNFGSHGKIRFRRVRDMCAAPEASNVQVSGAKVDMEVEMAKLIYEVGGCYARLNLSQLALAGRSRLFTKCCSSPCATPSARWRQIRGHTPLY